MKVVTATTLKRNALIWLLLAITSVAVCITQLSGQSPLQTNLLSLLPTTERNPVAEEAVNKLFDAAGNRIIFLIGADSRNEAISAAREFAKQLRLPAQDNTSVFKQVFLELPPLNVDQITDFYSPYQFRLLSRQDQLAFHQHTLDLQAQLQQKLYAPFQFGMALPIERDPFGLSDRWLSNLPLKNIKLEIDDGVLIGHEVSQHKQKTWVFISADPNGSAYSDVTQNHVINTLTKSENALKQAYPKIEVLRTGAIFYAQQARASAEKEMHIIGLVSLFGMFLLLYAVFRSIRPLVLGFLSVGFGIVTAVAVTIYVYGEIHLITLVFGASLIGEAIDFPIQYFAAHLGAGKDWSPGGGLRRVTPALALALCTSLLGYAVLSFMPFPALAQIALFAFIGLISAWASVYLLLPATLMQANKRNPEQAVAVPHRFLSVWKNHVKARDCLIAAAVMLLFALPGLFKLSGNDDIHLLVTQPPNLLAQETKIREIAGLGNNNQFFLIEGNTPETLLRNEEQLTAQLDTLIAHGDLKAYTAVSTFVPSLNTQAQNQALWETLFANPTQLRQTLIEAGLRDEVTAQFIANFQHNKHSALHIGDWLNATFSVPFHHLWLGKTQQGQYASIVLLQGIANDVGLQQLAAQHSLASVTYVDKAASVSNLFRDYRHWSSIWLLCAVMIILAILSARYGARIGAIVLLPTVLALTVTLGLFGYLNIPLSFFHMMGFMLVLGVGVNYAIFMREGFMLQNKTHQAASLAGVLLSSGTTLLSYGMLIFSTMPVLSNFGLTMLLGVSMAALLSVMVLSFD